MTNNTVRDITEIRSYFSHTLANTDAVYLTAHSHRAWPDVVLQAQEKAARLAFDQVDTKWGYVFSDLIPALQSEIASRLGGCDSQLIALGQNTHELVTRLLSCFPWTESTKIVASDGEFYSLKRQLYRLEEEGVQVSYVPSSEPEKLVERLIAKIDQTTHLVCMSTVLFGSGKVVPHLTKLVAHCRETNTQLLLDAYHEFGFKPMDLTSLGDDFFVTSGGYKYTAGGEGCAWMKIPKACKLRPIYTGWFADFAALEFEQYPKPVRYAEDAYRFMGATFDVTAYLRQLEVFELYNQKGWTVDWQWRRNLEMTDFLMQEFERLELGGFGIHIASPEAHSERGPFLCLDMGSTQKAVAIKQKLWQNHKVLTDCRSQILRMGPAFYHTETDLQTAMERLGQVLRTSL